MVDQEVVDILAEIKHRITASEKPSSTQNGDALQPEIVNRNSTDNSSHYPSLVVLARAWDRLPPVVSNRTGATADIELWLKKILRRALRWITWEQVNFNAASHQTFLELIESLNSTNKRLATLERLKEELETQLRDDNQKLRLEITTQRDQLEKYRAEIARYQAEVKSQQASMNDKTNEFELAIRSLIERQSSELSVRLEALKNAGREQASSELQIRLAELVKEFREWDERLLDEQRVCFKQLSLELTESQVLQDRARRELDTRVAKLEENAQN